MACISASGEALRGFPHRCPSTPPDPIRGHRVLRLPRRCDAVNRAVPGSRSPAIGLPQPFIGPWIHELTPVGAGDADDGSAAAFSDVHLLYRLAFEGRVSNGDLHRL